MAKIELLKPHGAFPSRKVGAKIPITEDLYPTARNLVCTGYAKWVGGQPMIRADRKPSRSGVLGTGGFERAGADADDSADD